MHGGVPIPSMVAGHWSPLTFVLAHLPLLPFQSLSTWRGDDPCTVISFVITDTLYLVLLASRSEVPW